jgi:hypothetical protein
MHNLAVMLVLPVMAGSVVYDRPGHLEPGTCLLQLPCLLAPLALHVEEEGGAGHMLLAPLDIEQVGAGVARLPGGRWGGGGPTW